VFVELFGDSASSGFNRLDNLKAIFLRDSSHIAEAFGQDSFIG
jgi:hypothetical protein